MPHLPIALPKQQDDSSAKFINFTEDFRHAKRTSLTWSAMTVFVALAPKWGDGAIVGGIKVPYDQFSLAALLLAAAVFFFASYMRSLLRVTKLESEAAAQTDQIWGDLRSTLAGLRGKLTEPESRIAEANQLSQMTVQNIDKIVSQFDGITNLVGYLPERQSYEDLTETHENILSDVPHGIGLNPREKYPFDRFVFATFSNFAVEAEAMSKRLSDATAAAKAEAAQLVDVSSQRQQLANERVVEAKIAIDGLENALTKFREAIGNSQKRWHLTLDIAAVCILFALAIVISGWRAETCEWSFPCPQDQSSTTDELDR